MTCFYTRARLYALAFTREPSTALGDVLSEVRAIIREREVALRPFVRPPAGSHAIYVANACRRLPRTTDGGDTVTTERVFWHRGANAASQKHRHYGDDSNDSLLPESAVFCGTWCSVTTTVEKTHLSGSGYSGYPLHTVPGMPKCR